MEYKVDLISHGRGKQRVVTIPTEEAQTLDNIFHYGQNDFQPLQLPSVSVGDVIHFDGGQHVVCDFGFKELDAEMVKNVETCLEYARENFKEDSYENRFDMLFTKKMNELIGQYWFQFTSK